MARIAHISDIHFGRSFNFDVWRNVREEIRAFHPSIIIASGDFVDSPDPLLLLAAKCELQDLAAWCEANTQFFVVPGNHDLLDLGNIWHPGKRLVVRARDVLRHDGYQEQSRIRSKQL